MLKSYLHLLLNKSPLTKEEAKASMRLILEEANPYQTAAFLSILNYRGETPEEVAGLVSALEEQAVPMHAPFPVLDIVGTGGDFANTVNISTGSAILAAACSIPIAKHGNRSVSSQSGSADVLEAMEIDIDATPGQALDSIRQIGIAFMYAPNYHPDFKKLSAVRKGLNIPTVFNLIGPLLNPAKADYSLIGVAKESLLDLFGQVILQMKNKKRVLLFHGSGLDELSTLGKAIAYDICNGQLNRLEINPISLGFSPCTLKELQGGNAQMNAAILRKAFEGHRSAVADALILNAGASVWIFGQAPTLEEGINKAQIAMKEGLAMDKLQKWVALSKQQKLQREFLNNNLK